MRHIWIGLSCIALIVFGLIGFVAYALRLAPVLNHQAKPVMDSFYASAQRHDYKSAWELFDPGLQSNISPEDLGKRWKKFESQHGPLKSWTPAAGQPGAVNLFPRFIDFDYLVLGKQGHGTRIFVRVVPIGNTWRITKLSLFS